VRFRLEKRRRSGGEVSAPEQFVPNEKTFEAAAQRFELDFRLLNAFPEKLQDSNLTLGLAMTLNECRGREKVSAKDTINRGGE